VLRAAPGASGFSLFQLPGQARGRGSSAVPAGGPHMSVIFLLIPLSIVIALCFLGAFIWAVRSGQYEDTCTPSMRLLLEEKRAAEAKSRESKEAKDE
jgi:cbb3-type cytochrome oxidase maturation protein